MGKWQLWIVVALLAFLNFLVALPVLAPNRVAATFEYRIEGVKDAEFQSELDRMGRGGWDLVFARRALAGEGDSREGIYEVIFKRPL